MYPHFVKTGILPLEKLIELMAVNPRKRLNIENSGFTVRNLEKEFTVDVQKFLSKGKATPFENTKLYGECVMTVVNNEVKYIKEN